MKFICFTWALVFLVACFKMYFISAILIGILLYIYVDVVYVKMMEYAHMRIRNGMVYEEKVQEMKESRFSRKITLEEATEIPCSGGRVEGFTKASRGFRTRGGHRSQGKLVLKL